jgi:chromate transporter
MKTNSSGLLHIFATFFAIGLQSFGGGASTLVLIREACLRNGWMDEETFVHSWALAQISPGINLLKLTILIGHRLRGWAGVMVAMLGLVLTSGVITMLMTAGFVLVREQPLVRAALKGILPATIGLSIAMGIQMALPLVARARREGPAHFGVSALILAGAALLMGVWNFPPLLVLFLAGGTAAGLFFLLPAQPPVDNISE